MKSRLAPHNETIWKKSLRDLPKFLAGKPSSYRKVDLPVPATKREVAEARHAIDATQKEFASVVGVSVETVKAWESGRRVPEGTATKTIRLIRKKPRYAEELAKV